MTRALKDELEFADRPQGKREAACRKAGTGKLASTKERERVSEGVSRGV